jgi:hypothetical protein
LNSSKTQWFIVSFCLAAGLAAIHAYASTMGVLRGVVTDSTGATIPGAVISIQGWTVQGGHQTPRDQLLVRTDSQGKFSVPLHAGLYDIFVSYPICSPFAKKIRIMGGKETILSPELSFDPLTEWVE